MSDLIKGFKEFIMKGNVVDLAVAVVIGAAFTAVIGAVVVGIVTPLIAMIIGKPSFEGLTFTINDAEFLYGSVISALITFLATAAVVYFAIVAPMNALAARRKAGAPEKDSPVRACPECVSDIPKEATRCAFCTAQVTPVA
jgi:large conductance mechanosensitive channel